MPPPVTAVRSDVHPTLAAIFERALAKRPEDRYASAAEMARALAPFAKATPLDPPMSALPSTPVMTMREVMEPIPQTIDMPSISIAPRTTPMPQPPIVDLTTTQRSSSHPPPTIALAPVAVQREPRSMAPWLIALLIGGSVILLAGTVIFMVMRR